MTTMRDGHQHLWGVKGCIHCKHTPAEVAIGMEPARHITVDPTALLGWEDGQNQARIADLVAAMRGGEPIEPIMVGRGGEVLYDGHHRRAAARIAGLSLRAVEIPSGWRQHGVGANLQDLRLFAQLTLPGAFE